MIDRSMFVQLPTISDERRRPETQLHAEFEVARPLILGALLDAVVHGLKHLPETRLTKAPRMADFARWATACEGALWTPGTFSNAYSANRGDAVVSVIEAYPVAAAIWDFMTVRTMWTGTATGLLEELNALVSDQTKSSTEWPKGANTLSNKLQRIEPELRKIGIVIEHSKEGRFRTRTITIRNRAGNLSSVPSAASAANEDVPAATDKLGGVA